MCHVPGRPLPHLLPLHLSDAIAGSRLRGALVSTRCSAIAERPRCTVRYFLPRCMQLQCRRGIAMRILCVRLSVCQTRDLWQNGRNIGPDFYIIRILRRRMVSGATPSTWNFGSTGSRCSEIADFQPIFARSFSAVTHSEKSSVSTNRKSTTRFPMSQRWTYVVPKPPKGWLENGKCPKFDQ